ncbi:hypothetical protein MRS44_017569 [Fusarium solani]|uniref:uncharacterized protein n=1 Tax=Fusarium solani TaxID=169388 RepID=UPI0032C48850|nr:hypothetical protein MRS44_017569 [Fusarium solani]
MASATSYAAATEGAQHADFPDLPGPNSRSGDRPISILESANGLARQRLQGQPAPLAPPPDNLRVFVRLEAEAPARNQIGYAIRTLISGKLGIDLGRIPQAIQVNTGWAIRTTGSTTRNLLIQRLRRADELLTTRVRPLLIQQRFDSDQATPLQTASKEESATAFHQWLNGTASYEFTIRQGDWSVLDGSGRLGSAEAFDAEATGALRGLQAALGHPDAATQGIVVCLDNLAAATRRRAKLNDGLKPSSGGFDSQ